MGKKATELLSNQQPHTVSPITPLTPTMVCFCFWPQVPSFKNDWWFYRNPHHLLLTVSQIAGVFSHLIFILYESYEANA